MSRTVNPSGRILLVEDDAAITQVLTRQLSGWGYDVDTPADFSDVMETFRRVRPHLVLLDISLPFRSGFYWCARIREESDTPVLFLSCAGDNMNQVTALNMGADDFIVKPFDLDVLVAKVRAMLRRAYGSGQKTELECRGAVLDLGSAALVFGGKRLDLSKNEFRILEVLMENKGRPVARDTIMQRLWENDSFVDDNTLTVNVARLRRRLEEAGLEGFILTRKGLGYLVTD